MRKLYKKNKNFSINLFNLETSYSSNRNSNILLNKKNLYKSKRRFSNNFKKINFDKKKKFFEKIEKNEKIIQLKKNLTKLNNKKKCLLTAILINEKKRKTYELIKSKIADFLKINIKDKKLIKEHIKIFFLKKQNSILKQKIDNFTKKIEYIKIHSILHREKIYVF